MESLLTWLLVCIIGGFAKGILDQHPVNVADNMSLIVGSPLLRAVLIVSGLAAVVAAAVTSTGSLLVLAILLLFPVITTLSQAGRLAAALQGLKHRSINAAVWGAPIRGPETSELRVESVGAMGAGLLIYLTGVGEAKTLLKVAQPRSCLPPFSDELRCAGLCRAI